MKSPEILSNMKLVQNFRKDRLAFGSGVATVVGMVSDFMQPVAPIIDYLFYLSVAALVIFVVLFVHGNKKLINAVVNTFIGTVIVGSLFFLQSAGQSNNGFIANMFPQVAELQKQFGLIDEKLDAIKEDTTAIKATTERVEAKTDTVIDSLDALKEGISSLGGDGIIAAPSTPEDHYHNARIHEIDGNYSEARKSYLEYFRNDLLKLDPHLNFISFLKVQEGSAGTRETYNEIAYRNPTDITAYAKLLLLPQPKRGEELQKYLDEHPRFAPAAYHLSLEFSERRLGSQTLAQVREELKYLQAFQKSDDAGDLLKYMIDQELVAEWRDDATIRLIAIQNGPYAHAIENPVATTWSFTDSEVRGNLHIGETATDIKWHIKGKTQPASTGTANWIDPISGKPGANTRFSFPIPKNDPIVVVSYTNVNGQENGPFEFFIDIRKEIINKNRTTLEQQTQWIKLELFHPFCVTNNLPVTAIRELRNAVHSPMNDHSVKLGYAISTVNKESTELFEKLRRVKRLGESPDDIIDKAITLAGGPGIENTIRAWLLGENAQQTSEELDSWGIRIQKMEDANKAALEKQREEILGVKNAFVEFSNSGKLPTDEIIEKAMTYISDPEFLTVIRAWWRGKHVQHNHEELGRASGCDGMRSVDFSNLLERSGALSKIEYGVDADIPNQEFAFIPYNENALRALVDKDMANLEINADVSFVTIRLTYKDGVQSDIVQFDRPTQ